MSALFQFTSNRLSVDDAAQLLKRLYWAERELFRATAALHGYVVDWETKKALPKHLWQDSLHADALRTRVLELRYPRRDVDQDPPAALVAAIHELVRSQGDVELLAGIYRVFKPALIAAYEGYLARTDALDDAPTVYHLEHLLRDKRAQLEEGEALLGQAGRDAAVSAWTSYLIERLEAAGTMLGTEPQHAAAVQPGFADRPGYRRPARLARDPRFEPALIESPWWTDRTPLERQLVMAIEHANEIWATEVPLLVAWELDSMPWEFYRDIARWAWDECRHAMMGERRLEAWGFKIGVDYPMIDDAYQCVAKEPPLALVGLLNAFERGAPPHRKAAKADFERMGDGGSAQDIDYDWADEAIHMAYGNRWMAYLVSDEDEIDALRERTLEQWDAYLRSAKTQPMGDYEPYESRLRARLRLLEGVS